MAFDFLKILKGLRLRPVASTAVSQKGDLEALDTGGKMNYHNGTTASPVVTESHTATLTNKTLTSPDITILDNTLKFQETAAASEVIEMTAPTDLDASWTMTLPPNAGTIDYVLRTNGAGATSWVPPTIDAVPTGVVVPFAGASASTPPGWFLCYGQAVSRVTYVNLFTLIGETYGAGDSVTTFNIPDLRGRAAVGKDDMGGVAANRMTSAGSGVDGLTLGAVGGAQTHTLTTAQLAAHLHAATGLTATASASSVSGTVGGSDGTHTHTFTSGNNSVNHTHTFSGSTSSDGAYNTAFSNGGAGSGIEDTGDAGGSLQTAANHTHTYSGTTSNQSANHTHSGTTDVTGSGHDHAFTLTAAAQAIAMGGSTANTGGGDAHNNTQPSIILNYIIKY